MYQARDAFVVDFTSDRLIFVHIGEPETKAKTISNG